ncbi:Uma2 family endonuclease [Trichocoleus sp. FACHB-90]|uniref:Uma2 family endonuclease n=1 Tax=Cyanophyceae TaxID=3028117 RepID=UPI0016845D15|nr:Uma2 family endonuclease [Trichocoleus sp. FACHB-90]MBD1925532.1 Uma2 family endonuclease [Trichocoleus sp. FACHB-90]
MTTVTPKRFTLDEYHRLGELGFFSPDDRVELIRGEIIQMPTKKTPHSVCNTRLWKELFKLVEERAELRVQEPIILPSDSEPQPDLVISRNSSDDYLSSHPSPADVLMVMEISDSTLRYDQTTKLSLYAEDGISDYWIFNLIENCLEIYSEPYQDMQGKFSYRLKRIALPNEVVALACFPDLFLDLSLVFPMQPNA